MSYLLCDALEETELIMFEASFYIQKKYVKKAK